MNFEVRLGIQKLEQVRLGLVDQARAVLLAAAGRESFDAATLWKHGAADRRAAGAHGVDGGDGRSEIRRPKVRVGEVSVNCTDKNRISRF